MITIMGSTKGKIDGLNRGRKGFIKKGWMMMMMMRNDGCFFVFEVLLLPTKGRL
jgi:hypothetical protein